MLVVRVEEIFERDRLALLPVGIRILVGPREIDLTMPDDLDEPPLLGLPRR
ncbi:MAG: hypothetical protein WKF54_00935 [Nocardioidaceae bacterium]